MATDDYEVGYRRPPAETQFKKGQSGNPRGRPPKSDSRRAITERVLGETQRLAGQPRGARALYTTLEVIVMKVKQLAASGHAQATALYTRIAERHGRQDTGAGPAGYLVVPERLTPEEWEAKYSPKDGPPGEAEEVD